MSEREPTAELAALSEALQVSLGPKRIEDYDPAEFYNEYAVAITAKLADLGFALRASNPSLDIEGLDVDRLARAMQEDARTLALVAEDYPVGDLDEYRPEAARLAAGYAALADNPSREDEP